MRLVGLGGWGGRLLLLRDSGLNGIGQKPGEAQELHGALVHHLARAFGV